MIENEQLEQLTRDYVRAGWSVTSRTTNGVALENGDQRARLYLDAEGVAHVEGPPLPALILDGRTKAWLLLLLIIVVVFAVAWAVGFFRA